MPNLDSQNGTGTNGAAPTNGSGPAANKDGAIVLQRSASTTGINNAAKKYVHDFKPMKKLKDSLDTTRGGFTSAFSRIKDKARGVLTTKQQPAEDNDSRIGTPTLVKHETHIGFTASGEFEVCNPFCGTLT